MDWSTLRNNRSSWLSLMYHTRVGRLQRKKNFLPSCDGRPQLYLIQVNADLPYSSLSIPHFFLMTKFLVQYWRILYNKAYKCAYVIWEPSVELAHWIVGWKHRVQYFTTTIRLPNQNLKILVIEMVGLEFWGTSENRKFIWKRWLVAKYDNYLSS